MKRWTLGSLAFAVALFLGLSASYLFATLSLSDLFAPPVSILVSPVEDVAERPASLPLGEPPVFDDNFEYLKKPKVSLLFTGDFHDNEVPYKAGERWIGLFQNGDDYELKQTTLVIRETEDDFLFSKNVSTKSGGNALFLLKGNTGLVLGSIDTAFNADDHEEFEIDKCDELISSFRIKGMFWRLCMENAPNGVPEKGTALILKGPGSETVLRTLPNGCNDCTWQLLWAGDLDNDANLDLLIDITDHYNVRQPTLFLSTQPNTVFATFRGVGC